MPPRTIAIGDIHGCSRALDALLSAIEPRPEDVIVTLGDYVNRGPDSKGVLERLIALEGQCTVVPILAITIRGFWTRAPGFPRHSRSGCEWAEARPFRPMAPSLVRSPGRAGTDS